MEIFVASTSPHKLTATEEAAKVAFPGKTLHVVGKKAASDINEQPVGPDETLQGALNRLQNLKIAVGETRYDLLVAMENGISQVHIGNEEAWFDGGWVVVEDPHGQRGVASTVGVRFDQTYVNEARQRGFETTTVGSVIAERTGADGADPHAYLTDGLLRRTATLKEALLAAVGQLRRQSAE